MQKHENCYENVWILSGTSDGPVLAKMLLKLNYLVFASVVTYKAGKSYLNNSKLHIIKGKLNDENEIIKFIKKNKIKFVIDATHPFALIITKNLDTACKITKTDLIRFERKSIFNQLNNIKYIPGLKDIKKIDLSNKNILLAIGSRFLNDTASHYLDLGANVYTRVLPTPEGISKAFGSRIKNSNIAILEPSRSNNNFLEKNLCDFWKIDYILCRDSGSYSQKNWEKIVSGSEMKLFVVKRPKLKNENSFVFTKYDSLINHVIKQYSN